MIPSFHSLDSLAKDILANIKAVVDTSREEGLYKFAVLLFFTKAWRTFRGVHLLCTSKLAEDGSILTRSLFESVVHLLYISKDPLKRATLFFEYEYVQKMTRYRQLTKNPTDRWSKSLSETLLHPSRAEALGQISKDYERVKDNYERHKRKDIWSGLSIKEMAKEVGLEYQYNVVYSLQSDLAHPNPRLMSNYLRSDESGFVITHESEEEEIPRVWLGATIYFLMVMDQANVGFKLDFAERIKAIDSEIKKTVGIETEALKGKSG